MRKDGCEATGGGETLPGPHMCVTIPQSVSSHEVFAEARPLSHPLWTSRGCRRTLNPGFFLPLQPAPDNVILRKNHRVLAAQGRMREFVPFTTPAPTQGTARPCETFMLSLLCPSFVLCSLCPSRALQQLILSHLLPGPSLLCPHPSQ